MHHPATQSADMVRTVRDCRRAFREAPERAVDGHSVDHALIIIVAKGSRTPAQVAAYAAKTAVMITAMRAARSQVRILVDRRGVCEQADAATTSLLLRTARSHCPGDRIAVIVDSDATRLQLRDLLDLDTHRLFVSQHAAMTWLMAHD